MKKIYVNENKLHLLNEGLYDNFSVEDADIIYYNKYQENWGDDEEEDMKDVYNILIYDMDGNQIYEEDGLLSYELDDLLGEDISDKICNNEGEINRNQQLKQYYPYCLSDFNSHTFGDINETAKKLFKNQLCDYFPNLHGYIMQDGTCINLGYDDHNTICKIPQINDKWEFIALGNIRCSESFFDLIQEPTYQQKLALRKLIANSNDLSVDIFSEDSDSPLTSAIYNGNPEPSYVLGEISRFFDEGIKLQGGYGMYESKNIKGKQLNEFFYRENQSNADNVIVKDLNLHLWWEDSGAYPFGWFDDVLYIGDESTMHSSPTLKALHDEINNRILNDGCEAIIDGTFNDEVDGYSKYKFLEHPDDVEYREENESEEDKEDFYYEPYFNEYNYLINDNITYNHTSDELDYKLQEMDISGRYWVYDKVISFWSSMDSEMMDKCIKDLIKHTNIDFYEFMYVYEDYDNNEIKYCTVREFINSENDIEFKADDRENKGIHLMKPKEKSEALMDFKRNRNDVNFKKLGKIPMAQYHNMIYQEDLENETEVLNENTFNNWFRKSVLVNDIGEPIKMYHGSNSEFDEFKKEYIGSFGAYEGYGFNFTPFRGRAESYNNSNVIEAYLRCENPMTSKSNKISINNLMSIIKELDYGKPYTDTIVAAYEQPTYREKWDKSYYRRALPVAANKIFEYNEYGDAGLYAEICLNGNGDKYKVIDLFERLGYDSVIFYDNDDRIKTVIVFEPNQIKKVTNTTFNDKSNIMSENFEFEVEPNDVDLSSFKMKETLNVDIWDNFETINSKVRLKLLDIADDFYNSLEINYIKPIDIVLTGSICNFNWSKFSDIDLHIVIDFNEISEKHEMVQEYLDAKKNEWNNQHEDLTIYGFNVELYVQNSHDFDVVDGTYSLEKNKWLKKPIREKLRPIDERKHKIQVVASDIMTKIDDMEEMFEKCDDKHKLEVLSNKIDKMLFNLKTIRKNGLNSKSAEMSIGNIIYKILRRTDYFDKLWHLKIKLYDKINSIF